MDFHPSIHRYYVSKGGAFQFPFFLLSYPPTPQRKMDPPASDPGRYSLQPISSIPLSSVSPLFTFFLWGMAVSRPHK